jgi:hypothetical protein
MSAKGYRVSGRRAALMPLPEEVSRCWTRLQCVRPGRGAAGGPSGLGRFAAAVRAKFSAPGDERAPTFPPA